MCINRGLKAAGFALVVAMIGPATTCFALDPIGTAGPIRTFGGKQCGIPYEAILRGECDPPRIDPALPNRQRSEARLRRALDLIAILRVEQAMQELTDAIGEDPRDVAALLLRGRLRIPGKLAEAEQDINRALQLDPDNPGALATRALLLLDQDDRGALRDASRALSLRPDDVDALFIRAKILIRINSLDEAEQDLDRAIALEPDNANALLTRSRVRMRIGKTAEAEADASAAAAVRGGDTAMQMRAIARVKSGDRTTTLADLTAILGNPGEVSPRKTIDQKTFVDLLIQRALLLARNDRRADARKDLDSIVTMGGLRSILQMQVYLRGHGFPDIELDGKRSDRLDEAMIACFIDEACGRGLAIPG
jgi:tetratricopeptide (TPR) repeat protein